MKWLHSCQAPGIGLYTAVLVFKKLRYFANSCMWWDTSDWTESLLVRVMAGCVFNVTSFSVPVVICKLDKRIWKYNHSDAGHFVQFGKTSYSHMKSRITTERCINQGHLGSPHYACHPPGTPFTDRLAEPVSGLVIHALTSTAVDLGVVKPPLTFGPRLVFISDIRPWM